MSFMCKTKKRILAAVFAALIAGQCTHFAMTQTTYAEETNELEIIYDQNKDQDPQRFQKSYDLIQAAPTLEQLVHNARFDDCIQIRCIDVSKWQGTINWSSVAASGIHNAIIRVGYRGYGSAGTLVADPQYVANLQGAAEAGVNTGVYFFTQAITVAEAVAEANYVLSLVEGYSLALPIYIDVESVDYASGRLDNAKLSKAQLTAICDAFCSTIEAAGYRAGVYANKNYLENKLNASELAAKYEIWLANYTTQTAYQGEYHIWQYSNKGAVSGISGDVDLNVIYSRKASYDEDSHTLIMSESITPTLNGDGVFTFSSSAPEIAVVDENGKITAVSSGTAEITAISDNGSQDTIEIIVSPVGDCNQDGVIDATDAAEVLMYTAIVGSGNISEETAEMLSTYEDILLALYDYNRDGVIDATDAAKILKDSAAAGVGVPITS